MNKLEQQVTALAAAFQALGQITEIAHHGRADPVLVNVCLQGLLSPYQADVAMMYGGLPQLRPGLALLGEQLRQPSNMELTRYLIGVLQLEAKLRKHPRRLRAIAADLEHARRQADFFDGLSSGSSQAALGRIYSERISTLRPQIMVVGERAHLQQAHNSDLIRALLLAAIRAVSFWRERGGRRFDLLLKRTRLVALAKHLRGV